MRHTGAARADRLAARFGFLIAIERATCGVDMGRTTIAEGVDHLF